MSDTISEMSYAGGYDRGLSRGLREGRAEGYYGAFENGFDKGFNAGFQAALEDLEEHINMKDLQGREASHIMRYIGAMRHAKRQHEVLK